MPGYGDGGLPSLRCALGLHKWLRPTITSEAQCRRCGVTRSTMPRPPCLWGAPASIYREALDRPVSKEKTMPTSEWLLARINTAFATDQMWMLDPLAIARAWAAQG